MMQQVFNGATITKKPIKKDDIPSGRDWNDVEKEKYYKNITRNYNDWKNEVIKFLYENKILEYKNHIDDNNKLEEKMIVSFNNGISANDFIKNFQK